MNPPPSDMDLPDGGPFGASRELLEHADFVRRLARGLVRDSGQADDVAQETWLASLEAPPRERGSLGWLARVTARFASRSRRGESRRRRREEHGARAERLPSTLEQLEHSETLRRVTDAVLSLEEPYRSTVLLRFYEGVEPAQIAQRMGCPRDTVYSRLRRGLALLRSRLDEGDGGRAAWLSALAPFARADLPRPVGPHPVGTGVGVAMMSTKTKFAWAAVALSLGVVGWSWSGIGRPVSPELDSLDSGSALELAGLEPEGEEVEEIDESAERSAQVADPDGARPEVAPTHASLDVRVVWEEDGAPAEVPVRVMEWASSDPFATARELRTNEAGELRVENLLPGTVMLMVSPGGGGRVTLEAGDEESLQLAIPRGITVSGRVQDSEGKPVPGAGVRISAYGNDERWHPATVTDDEGEFVVRDIESGRSLAAVARGHAPSRLFRVQGEPGEQRRFVLELAGQGGTLAGQVLDGLGKPVAGASLRVWGPEPPPRHLPDGTRTDGIPPLDLEADERGEFRFEGVAAGTVRLLARGAGLAASEEELEVRAGEIRRVVVRLGAGCSVFGTLRDAEGQPVPDGEFYRGDYASFGSSYTRTGKDGGYRIDDLPAGPVTLRIESDEGLLQEELDLTAGEARRWDPVLPARIPIEGQVVDEQGRGLEGWRVDAVSSTPLAGGLTLWSKHDMTDEAGRFSIRGAPEDRITLSFFQGWSQLAVEQRAVRPGDPEVVITVRQEQLLVGSLRGSIVGPDDRPMRASLRVLSSEVRGWGPEVASDASTGAFRFDDLRGGSYNLWIRPEGMQERTHVGIELRGGEDLDLGRIYLDAPAQVELVVDGRTGPGSFTEVRFLPRESEGRVKPGFAQFAAEDLTEGRLVPGKYRLVATGPEVALAAQDVILEAGQVHRIEIDSLPGTLVTFTGNRPAGEDDAFHYFGLLRAAGGSLQYHTELGPFTEPTVWKLRLGPGDYELHYRVRVGDAVIHPFTIEEGQPTFDLQLSPD